ncbi:cobalt transporter [Alsobacter soli]|uniref:Cobalt transporter n=1 Tax=Alsobacter soli TaxID=2109933 RepID=A0A2T1HZK0_9HYPH|nr:CbtB-domain containing protein [Alsobacter soli]PSC07054.1 cobalt transporter [Alsobacter soli]
MLHQSTVTIPASTSKSTSAVAQALFAVLLGAFIVGFAGFSNIGAVHNAAHDTRHANGFPCH